MATPSDQLKGWEYRQSTQLPDRGKMEMAQAAPAPTFQDWMSLHLSERLSKFLVDKGTGNVVLNIKDGQVMKLVIEEHIKG